MDPLVVLTFIIVGALQIAFPIGLGYWVRKKFNISWKVFLFGALFFILVQIIHVPLVLLIQVPLIGYLITIMSQITVLAILAVFLGLLAGLFEEPGRFLIFRYFFKNRKIKLNKESALMFGLGWGGIESIFVGIVMFLTMFSYMSAAPLTDQDLQSINDLYGGALTQNDLAAINMQNEVLMSTTPIGLMPSLFERIMTVIIHIGLTLLVLSAVLTSRKWLLLLAITWHAALNAFAVFFSITYGVLVAESVIFVFALIALWYIRRVFRKRSFLSTIFRRLTNRY